MTMHKALHPRDDVDSVDTTLIQRLEDYIEKHGGRLITTTRNNTNDTRTSGTTITRKQKWEEKRLYGRFKQLTSDISHEKTWTWLRKGNHKRETESLLIATQNNTIRINHIKTRIDKIQQNSKCRLCGNRDETTNYIISECSKLTQKEYKTQPRLGGQGDLQGIVQEIEVWPYEQMVYA